MKIKMDNFELRVIINCLFKKRNILVKRNEDIELIDEILEKYLGLLNKCKWLNLMLVEMLVFFCASKNERRILDEKNRNIRN